MQYIHLEGAIKDFWDFEATLFVKIELKKFKANEVYRR